MKRKHKIPDISLLIMVIWLNTYITNCLGQRLTTPAWPNRLKRSADAGGRVGDDGGGKYSPQNSEFFNGHHISQHDGAGAGAAGGDLHDMDDMMLHHHLDNMAYNMHQHPYQHNGGFSADLDTDIDSSLVGLGGLLPHELPEHDHIAHHLEMQTHEELLEDIRDDTGGVNIIPDKDLPKFGEPLQNVTVPVGREAVLQCVVDNLQTYKVMLRQQNIHTEHTKVLAAVQMNNLKLFYNKCTRFQEYKNNSIAWLRVDTQTILTIQNHVITKNHRMSITHAEKRAWILRIRDVKEADKGWYMCQINTDPMKSQVGYLDVVVPPDILDYPTSTDMVIREGSNVTLKCAAIGSPPPTITWRREGGELIPIRNGTEVISYNGSFLSIAKVNRLNMGAYLCIASNGIPPTVSKRVMLIVHFPPMIWIQNQLVGAALGQNITLECQSEAYPKSINYWMKNDTIIVPGERFIAETYENGYKITMRLTIIEVDAHDFGSYRCVAKNSLGDTDGAIKLYHIPQTTTVTTLAPTLSTNTILTNKYNKEQRYNFQQNNKYSNNNNNNNNNNNQKLQRTKSRMELQSQQQQHQQQQQQQLLQQQHQFQQHQHTLQHEDAMNNVHVGATSSLWNTQQQQEHYVIREQHYNPQGSDFTNYHNSIDHKSPLQHDANSLTLDSEAMHNDGIATVQLSIQQHTLLHVNALLVLMLGSGVPFPHRV